MDLDLDVADGVAALDLERDALVQRPHEDLHLSPPVVVLAGVECSAVAATAADVVVGTRVSTSGNAPYREAEP